MADNIRGHHLAIIPARSGSKSIIDKNIKEIAGKPLMAYTIEAAVASGIFEHVLLSTDSEEYAEIGRRYGAEVPYLRNPAFARDDSPTWEAVNEGLNFYSSKGENFDSLCLLQVTSPLRTAGDIREAYRVYEERAARTVIGVTRSTASAEGTFLLSEDMGIVWEDVKENTSEDQEDAETAWNRIRSDRQKRIETCSSRIYETGTIYIEDLKKMAAGVPYLKQAVAVVMDRDRSADINEPLDFELAAYLMEKNREDTAADISILQKRLDARCDEIRSLVNVNGLDCKVFVEAALLSDDDVRKAIRLFREGIQKMSCRDPEHAADCLADNGSAMVVMTGAEIDISPVLTTPLMPDLSLEGYTNRKNRPRQSYPVHYRVAGGLVICQKGAGQDLPEKYSDYPAYLASLDKAGLGSVRVSPVSQRRAMMLEDGFDGKVFRFLIDTE